MSWLRTPNGGYVDPLEVVAINQETDDVQAPTISNPDATVAIRTFTEVRLRHGGYYEIDDTPDRVWHAVMDARRSA